MQAAHSGKQTVSYNSPAPGPYQWVIGSQRPRGSREANVSGHSWEKWGGGGGVRYVVERRGTRCLTGTRPSPMRFEIQRRINGRSPNPQRLLRMTPEVLICTNHFSGLAILSDDIPPKGVT